MFVWLKSFMYRRNPSGSLVAPTNEDLERERKFSGIEERISQMEQALVGLTKISRRIHLSSDQNSSLLKDIQFELKNQITAPIEANEDQYVFQEQELLSLLDISTSQTEACQMSLAEGITTKLGWLTIAAIDRAYHPTDCEIIEASVEACEPGLVRHVIQQGYRTRENRLIRRAKVIVTRSANTLPEAVHPDITI
ncbi:MAG: hypothetical protein H7318_10420 [Oligoflexus sp.]|nr:hypothetical protein [Oligoflexus sp.]